MILKRKIFNHGNDIKGTQIDKTCLLHEFVLVMGQLVLVVLKYYPGIKLLILTSTAIVLYISFAEWNIEE